MPVISNRVAIVMIIYFSDYKYIAVHSAIKKKIQQPLLYLCLTKKRSNKSNKPFLIQYIQFTQFILGFLS